MRNKKYDKKYRQNHIEEIKEYNRRYWEDNKKRLLECRKEWHQNNNVYFLKYYREHKEDYRIRQKEWLNNNPEYCEKNAEYQKQYRANHKEQAVQYSKQYRKDNPEKWKRYMRQWQKNKRKTDLKYNLNHKISGQIYKSLKQNKNGWHWEDLVGYTLEDLIKRLRKTIPTGYTWENFMEGRLHIDHIIPISAWDYNKPEQINFQNCWSLKNLQLLPAKENMIKHNKLVRPFQLALKI